MSKSQQHGKKFEHDVLKAIGVGIEPTSSAVFDIPLGITASKCAGSIKSSQLGPNAKANICLSDASRVWNWSSLIDLVALSSGHPTIRLVIGVYTQESDSKIFRSIHDLLLELDEGTKQRLYGTISAQEIYGFHVGLGKEFFPEHEQARVWARATKENLQAKGGILQLNYKIDSKNQRRLQCSASLECLLEIAKSKTHHQDKFYDLALPLRIEGAPRQRKAKPTAKK